MAEYTNDDERLLAIVDFIKHYKKLIITVLGSISVIGISIFGLKSIQYSNNEAAGALYNQWIEEAAIQENGLMDDSVAFDELVLEFKSTGFAQLAILKKASALAENSQLDLSKKYFEDLESLSSGLFGNDLLNKMSKVSLARILISEKNYAEALNKLESLMSGSDPLVKELAGDALAGQKSNDLAIEQYNLAKDLYADEASKNIVIMKLNNIKQVL
jgi:predicted negative regulator of RcsB-dependent stress response